MGVIGSATKRLFPILFLGLAIITISNFSQIKQNNAVDAGYSHIDPIGSVNSQLDGLKFDTGIQYDAVFKGSLPDVPLDLPTQENLELLNFGNENAFAPVVGAENSFPLGFGDSPLPPAIDTSQSPDSPYREVFSLTSPDKKYWPIDLKGKKGYNANIIPHPSDNSQWVVVVQHEQFSEPILQTSEQLVCSARFQDGSLQCAEQATVIMIEPAIDGNCPGNLEYANLRKGPRDARVFYGPEAPYIMYGSQSTYICLGQWIQDARILLEPFASGRYLAGDTFSKLTEIRRPATTRDFEKNYFLFWDGQGDAYVNYDIYPERSFAKLDSNGIGSDIESSTGDQNCLSKLLPSLTDELESIHQATNSLLVTMCGRNDPDCRVDDVNTFIVTIVHHKKYKDFHSDYRPYVVLFDRTAPFAVHAIIKRPLLIHGQRDLTLESDSVQYREHPDSLPIGQKEFLYMTSMSWKEHGKKYHGYIDDEVFLAFGIEDSRSGVIDVKMSDLLEELDYC